MHVKMLQKNKFVENVWPANSALFIYVSTHCAETVKQLDYNRYSQMTLLCRVNASALGARGPGFNPCSGKGFYVSFFVLLLLCFYFIPKTHYFSQNFAIPSAMLIYVVY